MIASQFNAFLKRPIAASDAYISEERPCARNHRDSHAIKSRNEIMGRLSVASVNYGYLCCSVRAGSSEKLRRTKIQ